MIPIQHDIYVATYFSAPCLADVAKWAGPANENLKNNDINSIRYIGSINSFVCDENGQFLTCSDRTLAEFVALRRANGPAQVERWTGRRDRTRDGSRCGAAYRGEDHRAKLVHRCASRHHGALQHSHPCWNNDVSVYVTALASQRKWGRHHRGWAHGTRLLPPGRHDLSVWHAGPTGERIRRASAWAMPHPPFKWCASAGVKGSNRTRNFFLCRHQLGHLEYWLFPFQKSNAENQSFPESCFDRREMQTDCKHWFAASWCLLICAGKIQIVARDLSACWICVVTHSIDIDVMFQSLCCAPVNKLYPESW